MRCEMDQFDEIEEKIDRFMDAVYHVLWRAMPLVFVLLVLVQAYMLWRR